MGVTGGRDSSNAFLASTEIMSESGSGWTTVGALPTARHGLAGISLANKIIVTGGKSNTGEEKDVLKFDQTSKQWVKIGQMTKGRKGHAVSLLPLADAKKLCK